MSVNVDICDQMEFGDCLFSVKDFWKKVQCTSPISSSISQVFDDDYNIESYDVLRKTVSNKSRLIVGGKLVRFFEQVKTKNVLDRFYKMTEIRPGDVIPLVFVAQHVLKLTLYVWLREDGMGVALAQGKPVPALLNRDSVVVPLGSMWVTRAGYTVQYREAVHIPVEFVAQRDVIMWTYGHEWSIENCESVNNVAVMSSNQRVWDSYDPQSSKRSQLRKHVGTVKYTVMQQVENTSGHVVLDLCCGRGTDVEKWQQYSPSEVVFADLSVNSLRRAKKRYDEKHGYRSYRSQYVAIDLNNLKPLHQKFDLIWFSFGSQYVIPTLQSWDKVFSFFYEHLKEDGRIVIIYPDGNKISWGLGRGPKYTVGDHTFSFGRVQNSVRVSVDGCYDECLEYLVYPVLFTRYGYTVVDRGIGSWAHDVRADFPENALVRVCQLTGKPPVFIASSMKPPWKVDRYVKQLVVTLPLQEDGTVSTNIQPVYNMSKQEKNRFKLYRLGLGELAHVLRVWGYEGKIGKKKRITKQSQRFLSHKSREEYYPQLLYSMGLKD